MLDFLIEILYNLVHKLWGADQFCLFLEIVFILTTLYYVHQLLLTKALETNQFPFSYTD